MAPRKKADPNNKTVAENRKARYNYAVEDTLECGMMLDGSEVKSMRKGGVNIAESYAGIEDGELWLVNSHIPKYDQAKTFQHEERRRRKLLVSKKELSKLWAEVGRQGMTLVPLKIYFNDKGRAKLLLGIAKGKQKQDKRATEKKQDWKRQQSRLMRDRG
ncbi:SsrA-binding protein [Rhodobacterales bacterium 52_120_T64]|nr:SsrA-binding protein [Rhodobacterales bacterium 52_120_T64]